MTQTLMVLLIALLVRVTLFALAGWLLVIIAARFRSRAAMFGAAFTIIAAALLTPLAFIQLPDSWSMQYAFAYSDSASNLVERGPSDTSNSIEKPLATEASNRKTPPPQQEGTDAAATVPNVIPEIDWSAAAENQNSADNTKPSIEPQTSNTFAWVSLAMVLGISSLTLFGVVRFWFGWIGIHRLIRRSRKINEPGLLNALSSIQTEMKSSQTVRIYESSEVTSPLTVGVFQAAIVLPTTWRTWNSAQLRSALAHELAHIQSHDFTIALVAQAALSVHFYHPLLHWLYSQLRLQQEFVADAVASRHSGGADAYVQSLASLALESQPPKAFAAVRPFLPSVGVLMRRVSMLKTLPDFPQRSSVGSVFFPFAVATIVFALAIGAFGIRFTAAPAALVADDGVKPKDPLVSSLANDESDGGEGTTAHELTNLTDDGGLVIAVRPIDLLAALKMKDKKGISLVDGLAARLYPGLSAKDIEQLAIVMPAGMKNEAPEAALLRTKTPHDFTEFMTAWSNVGRKSQLEKYAHNGKTYYESPFADDLLLGFWQADDRTLLVDAPSDIRRRIDGKSMRPQLLNEQWKKHARNSHFAVAATGDFIGKLASGRRIEEMHDPGDRLVEENIAIFGKNVDKAYLSVKVEEEAHLNLFIICHDDSAAKTVAAAVDSSIRFGRKGVRQTLARMKGEGGADRKTGESALMVVADVLADLSVKVEGQTITVTGSAPVKDFVGAQLSAALVASREAARRTQSMNNLKRIALAMHNYHDTHGHLPPPVVKGEKGQVHSWRVEILPYIEGEAIYKKYRFDEPWDSPANKALIPLMPDVFRMPGDKSMKFETPYQVLVGEKTMYPKSEKPIGFRHITDGTSNTIMAIETDPKVEWTKPVDIAYDADKPLPAFGKIYKEGFVAAIGDGSVRFISNAVDKGLLRILITRDDGKVVPEF